MTFGLFRPPAGLCLPAIVFFASSLASTLGFDTGWQGDALANQWNDGANWTFGVPDSSMGAILSDVPSGQLQIDGADASAGSILVGSGSSAFAISSASSEALWLYGDFVNSSAATVNISTDVNLMTNFITLAGFAGLLDFYGNVNGALNQTTLDGTVSFSGALLLGLDSASSYGSFVVWSGASVDLTGLTTLSFPPSSYTGGLNDAFQLFDVSAGSWSGASEFAIDTNSLPTLTGGLAWSTSNFETNGSISVVPEPGTIGLLLLAGALCGLLTRKASAASGARSSDWKADCA